jgi:hypothetical protein
MQRPIALGQLQIMTPHALVANAQFSLECSIAGTRELERNFKVQECSSNITVAFGTNQDR